MKQGLKKRECLEGIVEMGPLGVETLYNLTWGGGGRGLHKQELMELCRGHLCRLL